MFSHLHRKFLVVDALAGVQTFARQQLQGHGIAPDHVLCCADPEAALAQGLSFRPDVLITDWFSKESLNGLQLHGRLQEALPGLQLGLLSFEHTAEHEREAQARQAHFLLKKPFTAEQMRAALHKLLDELNKQTPPPPRYVTVPAEPAIKPGDQVRYNGQVHTVQYVVHRQGATVVQLKGQAMLIPVTKLQPR